MILRKVALIVTLALGLLSALLAAEAQQANVPRIGVLTMASASAYAARLAAFDQGLRELGWIEGQNIVIERRYGEGKYEKLRELAAELVRSKVDVIVAVTPPDIRAAKQATTTIPIVMVIGIHPVSQGLIASLARPGANLTGSTWDLDPEISGKYLDFLKEVVPRLSRVGGLIDPANPGIEVYRKAGEAAAPKLGLTIEHVEVREPTDFENAFATLIQQRAQALFVYGSPLIRSHLGQIVDLAAKHQLPDMYIWREAVAMGGLMSYSPRLTDFFERAATYVDKILKGAKPADLPVEQPTRFEFLVNLKRAKVLGLAIPQSVLIRADQVIE
ncbi:MAG: ABC transporter substrate-binding protein [Candidatus Rokubacteria bacterium]|nr:ABC transporter substrate-binding protein [Candidatus Rokubacteria bacterium]